MITILQAAAIVTLWRSGRFDTLDIATVLGGGLPKLKSAASSTLCAAASGLICMWSRV